MYVPESSLFKGTKVQILSSEGNSFTTHLDAHATIETVKFLAIAHFYPGETSTLRSEQFRIIFPANARSLTDSHAVHEEKLKENDVLLLVKRRHTKGLDALTDTDVKAPTLAEINAATSHLEAQQKGLNKGGNNPKNLRGQETAVDFQMELRKIIISLVSVMSNILQTDKDAELICKEMHRRLVHRLKAAPKAPADLEITFPPPPEVPCTPMGIVQGLAEAKKREFRPNLKAVENLKEMGFRDTEIFSALRACKNNKDQACEWLLSGGGVVIDDIDTGLDTTSPLFKALITNPTIRLGLNGPKTLLAFLGILENPASANIWLTDGDTSPVLSAIFKIYHSEKHAVVE